MGALSDDMKAVVERQRLGFVATVCPDGTPSLSPKGTVSVLDDDHLAFADIRSPGTVANLRLNPGVELNVVDPFTRKGYRFKGQATIVEAGAEFERLVAFFASRALSDAFGRSLSYGSIRRVRSSRRATTETPMRPQCESAG